MIVKKLKMDIIMEIDISSKMIWFHKFNTLIDKIKNLRCNLKHDIKFEILYNFLKELKDPLVFVPINSFKKLFNMFYRGIFFIAFLCQKKVEKGSNKIVIVYRCGGSMCGTHTLWERYSMHLIWNIHFYTSESILIVWGT